MDEKYISILETNKKIVLNRNSNLRSGRLPYTKGLNKGLKFLNPMYLNAKKKKNRVWI